MTRRILFATLVIALAAAIALMPMRVALDFAGKGIVAARDVRGTIWAGAIDGARIGPVVLGDVDAGLRPLALLGGRAAMDFSPRAGSPNAAPGVSGTIYRDLGGGRGLSGLSGGVDGGALDTALPIGRIAFVDASADFDADGRCRAARGEAQVTLGASVGGLNLTRGLSGPLACDGERLHVALSGQSGMERADVTLSPDRRYRVVVSVESGGDVLLGAGLRLAGFRPVEPGRFALVRTGAF